MWLMLRAPIITTMTITALAPLIVMVGCSQNGDNAAGSTTQGAVGGSASLVAAGKVVYDAHGCATCHVISGEGGNQAPELTRVGAEVEHSPEWLVAHVKNPKGHKPDSRMPAFEGKINDKDLLALGAYLASLK